MELDTLNLKPTTTTTTTHESNETKQITNENKCNHQTFLSAQ